MAIRDRRALKHSARELLLQPSSNAGKLVLLHAGAAAVFAIALAVVDYILIQRISDTSGLGGLGTRTLLQTVQQALTFLSFLVPLFWNMGYTYTALGLARREAMSEKDLLQGFRRFGPVLRLLLLEVLLMIIICIPVFSIGSTLLSATPLGTPYYKVMLELIPADGSALDIAALDETSINMLMESMTPILIGCFVLCGIVLIPVLYRLRLTNYFLMDTPSYGALASMLQSARYTRRRCFQLLRLDLSFWWYYAGQLLVAALAYGDQLLAMAGITLPISADAAFFLFYGLGLVCQVALYRYAKNQVELTYVLAYEAMRQEPAEAPSRKEKDNAPPWGQPPLF